MFAENLSRIAKSKNTTPSAILKKLNLSTSKLTAWNNGSLPKPEIMQLLAKELDCSVADFFVDPNDPYPDAPEQIINGAARYNSVAAMYHESEKRIHAFDLANLSEDEQDLVTIFRACSRREQHEIMAFIYKFEKE